MIETPHEQCTHPSALALQDKSICGRSDGQLSDAGVIVVILACSARRYKYELSFLGSVMQSRWAIEKCRLKECRDECPDIALQLCCSIR